MGFRNDFINGYLMTPAGRRQRTFAQWSLEHTVDTGLRANQEPLEVLNKHVKSAFEAGVERIAESHLESAKLLQRELQFQADNIIEAIDRGTADVTSLSDRHSLNGCPRGKLIFATLPAEAKRGGAARLREGLQRKQKEIDGKISQRDRKTE